MQRESCDVIVYKGRAMLDMACPLHCIDVILLETHVGWSLLLRLRNFRAEVLLEHLVQA